MINIYGSPKSSAGRCFWTLEEINQPYEAKPVNFREKEHQSDWFTKINPNGKVPVLTDGDFTIWESMAINFYLADKYESVLLGRSPEERGLVHQWSIWSIADLQPPLIDVFIQLTFVPEERRDHKKIEKSLEKLPKLLKTMESRLEDSEYLAGSEFSLADLNTMSVVNICGYVEHSLKDYPHIIKWQERVSKRSAYQRYMKLCE